MFGVDPPTAGPVYWSCTTVRMSKAVATAQYKDEMCSNIRSVLRIVVRLLSNLLLHLASIFPTAVPSPLHPNDL